MSPRERPPLVLTRSDAAKLERIWNDHATTVLGMLKAFCASPEDAQDALQELFLRVGKNIAVVESAKSPRAFLIVSARRIAIDTARKRAADQRRHESPEAAEAVHPSPEPARNDPETAAAISAAVRELPPEQRAVFEAKILGGKTLAVIAAEQSITLNTAASRLRYSLDKIRARLRPHYTAMKNQTNKPNTLTDSSERLIKPLEPKRVPSVVPGLEGAAALAIDDFHHDAEPEVVACELPPSSFENFEEPILVVCEPFIEPPTIDLPAEEQEPIDLSEQPVEEILTGIFEGETPIDPGSEDLVGEDGSLFSCWNDPSAFDGELHVIDDSSGDTGDESGTDDGSDWDLGEYYNDLLNEYDAFLVENPDWITENSGGDMHAQVITPSQYTGLELADPGAARAFDLWFEQTYLTWDDQQDGDSSDWSESGSFNLSGDNHTYGTVISYDKSGDSGIPEAWMRGGQLDISGGAKGHFIFVGPDSNYASSANIGIKDIDGADFLLPTPVLGGTSQTVVTGGTLDISQPVNGTFTVEKGAAITTEEQTFGEGTYQFSADATVASVASQESDSAAIPVVADSAASPANQASESFQVQAPAMIAPAVTPIVSGSDSVIEPPVASTSIEQPSVASFELPVLVETASNTHAEEPVAMDDIAFTDDDSFVPAPTESVAPDVVDPHASANDNVTAAVGGALVVGTATQSIDRYKSAANQRSDSQKK